jgi:hypothetical protein
VLCVVSPAREAEPSAVGIWPWRRSGRFLFWFLGGELVVGAGGGLWGSSSDRPIDRFVV